MSTRDRLLTAAAIAIYLATIAFLAIPAILAPGP